MNQTLIIAAIVGVAVFIVLFFVFSKLSKSKTGSKRTQDTLRQLMEETHGYEEQAALGDSSLIKEEMDSPILRSISALPMGDAMAAKIRKAGMGNHAMILIGVLLLIFLLLGFGISRIGAGPLGFLVAIFFAFFAINMFLDQRIRKRNDEFIKMFPDVLDMIVRSVRSGFPLNTALKMVADNMEPPVSTEFRQVTDEVALGMSMDQALARLGERVDEPDIHFFVVVLNVQSETGGNLAEIISNLSGIIRKRKQLRQKIRAMTSEGRATSWVLGALPVVVFLAISYMSPHHLEPLYDTLIGNMIFATAIGLILLTFWVVNQMIDIDI